ncbi:MAG: diaminopimelate decarboxylase [Actinomycetota bacterium]|nr:diaminopimelate decarboxylase [Actinomycetota bacterium]
MSASAEQAAFEREFASILPRSSARDDRGRLTIGGCSLEDVARAAGTPTMIADEGELRTAAREYQRAFTSRWPASRVYFASKAFSCSGVIRVFAEEGLGCDVASAGELAVALAGGMPADRILLHGNAKRDVDLAAALNAGVGLIVVDSLDELDRLERLATRRQRLLLRANPAVAASTHEAMATGHSASKFGLPPEQLREAARRIAASRVLELDGIHAHIGSQIVELEPFERCVEALAGLVDLRELATVDLGGGLGVRYTPDEPEPPRVEDYAGSLIGAARRLLPEGCRIIVEPGRSLVARAMVTVYRVVSVKRAGRTFVAVDGGMGDNLEPMMYGTRFSPFALDAQRPLEPCDVVGPHCETGDRLVEHAPLAAPAVGDAIVVPMTGAYCYALANNYNGSCRPPVVLCHEGRARIVQRRERIEDLLARDCELELEL